MRRLFFSILQAMCTLLIVAASGQLLVAQQQLPNPDDFMKPDDFSRILKDEWGFLKDATDDFLASTSKKTEFETTNEFGERVAKLKAAYINKIENHIKEKKFDKRVFGVVVKASLDSYNADTQQYLIAASETIEAPYDIPSVRCVVPPNPYVILTDSVNRGFRTSALRVRFSPGYRWSVSRDEAKMAKADEPNIYFQVRFVLDVRQEDMVKQAKMKMIPTHISMVSLTSHKVYWETDIK
ncbi:MAG TPA: DUF4852 domain-containing protein [Bacteroidota bacterium]